MSWSLTLSGHRSSAIRYFRSHWGVAETGRVSTSDKPYFSRTLNSPHLPREAMDGEKNRPDDKSPSVHASAVDFDTQQAGQAGGQRIQFIPTARPERGRATGGKEDALSFVAPVKRRSLSVHSIPQVISEKDKSRLKVEQENERNNVDIDEHLILHQEVAERYKTRINLQKPEESLGLTGEQAAQLLHEYGPNILTPPPKRHWFLKYLDCLRSLFNLLLILAGVLEVGIIQKFLPKVVSGNVSEGLFSFPRPCLSPSLKSSE